MPHYEVAVDREASEQRVQATEAATPSTMDNSELLDMSSRVPVAALLQ